MHYENVSARIPRASTGVYLAFPTTIELKPVYRGYKTRVNSQHTKVGIARNSFASREHQYIRTFQSEVAFFPVRELPVADLAHFEKQLLVLLREHYARSGPAREWFHTTDRQGLAELVWSLRAATGGPW